MGLPRCQVSQSCIMILEGIYGPDLFPFSWQFDASDQDTCQIYWSLFFLDKIIGNSNSNSTLSRFFGQHCYHATSILPILRYVEGNSNQTCFTIKYYTDVCSSLFHLILSPFLVARSRWLEDLAGRPSPELGQKMWLPCKTCFLSTDPLQMLQWTNGSKMGWLQEVGHFTRVQCSTIQTISLIVYLCLSISWVFKCS